MEKEQTNISTKTKKKLPKWATITLTCFGVALAASAGVAGGIILGNVLSPIADVDYENMTIADYEDDANVLLKRYSKSQSGNYLKDFKPYELASIARAKVGQHENVHTVGIGLVNATMGVKQTIRSYYIKDNDQYFFENISKSAFAKINFRFYQSGQEVETYEGSGEEITRADWPDNPTETSSLSEYEEKWGRDLSRTSILIISSKTVLNDQSSAVEKDGQIHLSLELDPITSVLRYVKQMKSTSKSTKYPTFHKMHIDMVLDKELNLLSSKTAETYDVEAKGLTSKNTTASLEETFTYDQNEVIPEIHTDCNY